MKKVSFSIVLFSVGLTLLSLWGLKILDMWLCYPAISLMAVAVGVVLKEIRQKEMG